MSRRFGRAVISGFIHSVQISPPAPKIMISSGVRPGYSVGAGCPTTLRTPDSRRKVRPYRGAVVGMGVRAYRIGAARADVQPYRIGVVRVGVGPGPIRPVRVGADGAVWPEGYSMAARSPENGEYLELHVYVRPSTRASWLKSVRIHGVIGQNPSRNSSLPPNTSRRLNR